MTPVRRDEQMVTRAEADLLLRIQQLQQGLSRQHHHPLRLILIVPESFGRRMAHGDDPFHPGRLRLRQNIDPFLHRLRSSRVGIGPKEILGLHGPTP